MGNIQLSDFLGFHSLSSPAYNESGRLAAYVVSKTNPEKNTYDCDIWLYNSESKTHTPLTTNHGTRGFVWWQEEQLVYPKAIPAESSPSGEARTEFFLLDTAGMEKLLFSVEMAADLVGCCGEDGFVLSSVRNLRYDAALAGKSGEERAAVLKQLKEEDECCTVFDEYPFWFNAQGHINKTRRSLFLYSLKTGECRPITAPAFRVHHAAVDRASGRVVYDGAMLDRVETYCTGIRLYDAAKGQEVELLKEEVYHIENVGFMGPLVVFSGSDMKTYGVTQCPDLMTIDPATKECKVLYHGELSVGNPVGSDCRYGTGATFRAKEDRVYFASGIADASHLYCCDAAGKLEAVIEKDGSIDSFDISGDNIIMVAMHDMRLQELYSGSVSKGSAQRVSDWNEQFHKNSPPVVPERLWFENADGVDIHGFVLKPVGYDAGKKYPAILDIHGGPHLAYGEVYYHEMQFWAHQGYFVLFCNPRGGDGRGNEFGYLSGKFGTIDYADIMEFCDRALEAYPAMDPARMGVTGGSYGGFMTNWIIGHTHRFAAAASQRGIANFISMEGTSDIGTLFARGQILATTATDPESMWNQSPLKYAGDCKTPTLFIHSEEDYRCWMVEALQMYTALINGGVDTKLCLFRKENHELSRGGKPKSRVRRLQEITGWMDRYLKQS